MPDVPERGAVLCRGCFGASDDRRPGDGIATIRWWLGCDAPAARRWLAGWLGLSPALSAPAIPRPVVRRLSVPEPSGDPRGPWAADADRLADAVLPVVPSVRVMSPGDAAKDPRAWIVGGADRSMIEAVATDAPMRALRIGRACR